ncbi:MAG: tRNA (adenosine(37)-N6)-threonylcarbamoyltransferase complex dimerization subunit type 1 TsaB [Ignavibacteriales bacterium]|nr:tRNA (adenosine(37)-N6)-threonylcarbamoyltransferase complex dimerization subunit type 1 TsaB [Ignavibacteriales bacterium]
MTVLGIETSTAVCAVGLISEGKKEIQRSLVESHIHSEKLLTLVQEVVAEAGIKLSEIDCVAISIGPGSFTGLRIGLSTAKGLCYALGKQLVAVSTFEAIAKTAFDAHPEISKVAVMIDAKKSEYYVGRFEKASEEIKPLSEIQVLSFADAVSSVAQEDQTLILTDSVSEVAKAVRKPEIVKDVHQFSRGSAVAKLGMQKARANDVAAIASLEPMYLKDFVVHLPVAQ